MDFNLKDRQGWILVKLGLRVDAFNEELVSDKLSTLLRMGKTKIALRMDSISYLSLSFIRKLMGFASRLDKKSGELALVGLKKELKNELESFNFGNKIRFYDQVDQLPKSSPLSSQEGPDA